MLKSKPHSPRVVIFPNIQPRSQTDAGANGYTGHTGPLVHVRFIGHRKWTSNPEISYLSASEDGQGSYNSKYFYGILIKTVRIGKFSYFDPFQLLTSLAVMAVYLSVPTVLVKSVAMMALGPLSKIYKQEQESLEILQHDFILENAEMDLWRKWKKEGRKR